MVGSYHKPLRGFQRMKALKSGGQQITEALVEGESLSAPSKARNKQSVRIRPMQRLTTGIEPTTTQQMVTNVVKLVEGTYQAATQVKVLSPEIFNVIEADVLQSTESSMKDDVMVSHHSLYRGRSPWHGKRWKLRELGRSFVFPGGYVGTSQQRQELTNDTKEVGLTDSTLSLGKPSTWGSGQQWRAGLNIRLYGTLSLLVKGAIKFSPITKCHWHLMNAPLKSRVRENRKHGSVGGIIVTNLLKNL